MEAWGLRIGCRHGQGPVRALFLAWRWLPSCCVFTRRKSRGNSSGTCSYEDNSPIMRGPCSLFHPNLITYQRFHLQISSRWGWDLQYVNFEVTQFSPWQYCSPLPGLHNKKAIWWLSNNHHSCSVPSKVCGDPLVGVNIPAWAVSRDSSF